MLVPKLDLPGHFHSGCLYKNFVEVGEIKIMILSLKIGFKIIEAADCVDVVMLVGRTAAQADVSFSLSSLDKSNKSLHCHQPKILASKDWGAW